MNFHPRSMLFALKLEDILSVIELAPYDSRYAYGEIGGKEPLIQAVQTLPIDKQGRIDSTRAVNAIKDCSTMKLPGDANIGIEWIIRSLRSKRVAIGPVLKVTAHNSHRTELSYDNKRIHLNADLTIKCNSCGKVHSRPGSDFLCYPHEGKVIQYNCGNCETEGALFELEGIGDDFVVLRYAGGNRWNPSISGQYEELKYKGHYRKPEELSHGN
ncbi:hypothetical protein [Vibrio harveyi]|uniref:hypothetical protein n=1 Tax=Vibrio harveyi TaxID=669 RepID=UPI003CF92833